MRSKFCLLAVFLTIFLLSGCGCFRQAMKGEVAPPKPPEVVKAVPEAKKEEVIVKKEEVLPPKPVQVVPAAPAPSPRPAVPEVLVKLEDINFDFDKYNIRPGDAEILKRNVEWFKKNPGKKVRIEGHCDERGTVEYNLVLGQKRADATKSYLVNLGVNESLLETISYGKERPLDPGHNEEAWAKNRRAHFEPLR